jgi:hypothetical protein
LIACTPTVLNIILRITSILSLYKNWYLYRTSTINKFVCVDDGLLHFRLGLRAISVVRIIYIYEIKTKTITCRVGVYKQIVGLYVIDNLIFLLNGTKGQTMIYNTLPRNLRIDN